MSPPAEVVRVDSRGEPAVSRAQPVLRMDFLVGDCMLDWTEDRAVFKGLGNGEKLT